MTLGSEQGVTDICGSTDAALIGRQLVVARARLDLLLLPHGLTAPATDVALSNAVNLLASSLIAYKPGATDPRTNFEVDGFSRKDTLSSQIEEYAQQAIEIIADYIVGSTTAADVPLPKSTTG